ncbi:MAG TPA: hypothetical protein VFN26_15335 [Candidatus Acidoferrum sp.]|nr:hypothetical protein [Candidatus Acidoferrum sp.]
MAPAILSVIAFLALMVWRFVFAGLRHRQLAREIAAPQQQHTSVLEQGLHILDLARVAVIPNCRFEDGSDGVHLITPKVRAKTYLCRIVALTGATQIGDAYVLDVGKMRFHVDYRYVRRLRDSTDPGCVYEETCFYPVHKGMPKAEEIATALLQLTNNPALFDKWAVRSGQAIKADGQVFNHAQ